MPCCITARGRRASTRLMRFCTSTEAMLGSVPGMYVRVLLDQGVDTDAIAIPEQAVQRNGGGGSEVFVVKDDNRTAVRPVRLGTAQEGRWLVVDGLKPGDRVVVDGFQKFTAGDSVNPKSVTDSAEADAGAVPVIVGSR